MSELKCKKVLGSPNFVKRCEDDFAVCYLYANVSGEGGISCIKK